MRILTITILALALLSSCRNEDPDGPNLNDLFGAFSIVEPITPSSKNIDFAVDGDLIFNGELSKNTDWIISLTGATSGATRNITGFDRIFSSETAAWNGGANSFPAFGQEDVYVSISFPDEATAPVLTDTLTITGIKTDAGTLITGFENGFGTRWSFFNQATVTGGIVCGNGQAAKGDCYYSFSGTVGWDWAIGSVMVQADAGTFNLPASAANLYFNLAFKAIESYGQDNSFIQLWFDEDEDGSGTFDVNSEDRFLYDYWSRDSTWDLISVKYEDLQFDVDGNQVVTNGNGLPEPSKLIAVNIFFLSNPANGNARALVDHMIFTSGEPYTP